MPSITQERDTLAQVVTDAGWDTALGVLDAVEASIRKGRDPLATIALLRQVIGDYREFKS